MGAVAEPTRSLRVVELAQGVAGPVTGRLFAGLGHDVVKCEPPTGDYLRGGQAPGPGPDAPDVMAFAFAALNAGKRSVAIDLDSAEGRRQATELIATADVVISDLAFDHVDALCLRGEARRERWPELVTVSVTGFGLDSPWSTHRPDSLLAESFGGLAVMIGEPTRRPLSLGGEQAAHAAGFVGFLGAMLALEGVRRGYGGDVAEVALSDVAAYIDWKSDVAYAVTGAAPRRGGVRLGRWRMVPALDGWVGVIYQPDQWASMVQLVGDPRLADPRFSDEATRDATVDEWWPVVEEWAAARTRDRIYQEAQGRGLAFGVSTDMADLTASAHYRARDFIPEPEPGLPPGPLGMFFTSAELAWRTGDVPALGQHTAELLGKAAGAEGMPRPPLAARPAAHDGGAADGPLAGMVVLDLGTITAGAATGRLLADYGATVIKIEAEDHPDSFRRWVIAGTPPEKLPRDGDTVSVVFESNNAGKLGVTLDLKSDAGRAAFRRLVAGADVVVENFRVGVTERLGVDYASLREINPNLIYLSLSSQGQNGPEALSRSYGSTLDMLSGLASVTGYGDGPPMWSSADVNYPDQLVSLFGAAVVSYCWNRGVATYVDVAQRETVSWTLSDQIEAFRATGRVAGATGNRRPGAAPHDVYPCAGDDRWVAIACFSDEQRAALARVVGLEQIDADRKGADGGEPDDVDRAVAEWTGARSREECVRRLGALGVPCVPVLDAAERMREPHFVRHRVFLDGPVRRKGFPLTFEGHRPPDPGPAPQLGEHTDLVLGEGSPVRRVRRA